MDTRQAFGMFSESALYCVPHQSLFLANTENKLFRALYTLP